MDLDSTLETVAAYIPDELSQVIAHAASYVPTEINIANMAKFLLFFGSAALILGLMGRIFLGKRSSLNHSLSSVMGILFIYAVTIVVYTFKPWNLEELLSPLPFVTFSGDYLIVLPVQNAKIPVLCSEILSLVILAFLVNLLDSFIPQGKSVLGWYELRFLTVVIAMLLHLAANWAIRTYLPDVLVTYAPTMLLILLIGMLMLGLVNLILGVVLAVVNPILGGIYTFFFSNAIGKQLTKAVFTTAIVCVVFFLLGHFGYTLICIDSSALTAYLPFGAVLLVLWYLIGHVL